MGARPRGARMPWKGSDGAVYSDLRVKAETKLRRWEVVSQPLDRLMVVAPRHGGDPLRLEWFRKDQLPAGR
jgi:hypothetical protein